MSELERESKRELEPKPERELESRQEPKNNKGGYYFIDNNEGGDCFLENNEGGDYFLDQGSTNIGDHNENSNPATTSYSVQLGCISIAHGANNRMQTKYDGVHSMNDAKLMHIYNELATDMEIGSSVGPRLRANLTGIWLRLVTMLEISVHFHFYAMTNYPKISNDYQTNTLCSVSSSITMT